MLVLLQPATTCMRIHFRFVWSCAVIFFLATAFASASSRALIVIGTTGSVSVGQGLRQTATTIQQALEQRGFAPDAIEILASQEGGPKIGRDDVLARIKDAQKLSASDEYWVVLLGFSGETEDDAPAFQVSGPRLQAADLKTALDAVPARQFVFVGTSDAGAFVPILLGKAREVLSATAASGEIDLPRYPEQWATALKENPKATWKQLAARAADLTSKAYAQFGLAPGEHSRLGDPATGQVLEPPFGVDLAANDAPQAPSGGDSMELINVDDIKVDIHKPNSEWESQAATDETKRLIAEAAKVPNHGGFSAVMLEQRLGYHIGDDRTAESMLLQRVYIEREDAVARWANYELPQDPPAVTTKLIAARVIQPDGSATVFNPDKMPDATDCSSGLCGALSSVFIPGVHAGCLVEIAYKSDRLLDASDADYSEELPVQQDVPVMLTQLQLQIPTAGHLHFRLRNLDAPPAASESNGVRTITWKLHDLPAFESLPFDPPEHDLLSTLDVSSLDSWNQFAVWYRRLASGSDEQSDSVKTMAQQLASTATGRVDKIRKAFDFVSSLRYVAIEFGINGIRPRTPGAVLANRYGDCKDKANLLVALLTDMGVEAHFCLLNRGSSTDVSFPSWQFNHAIAYVPKDATDGQVGDLWLDTTDSTAPFPSLAPGDIGRKALVFSGDSADFKTVTAPGESGAEYAEQWQLRENGDNSWSGTLATQWGGLAEYSVRSAMRGLSPQQRDFALQSLLARQFPSADFHQLNLSPTDDLTIPLKLTGAVHLGGQAYPLSAFNSAQYFVASDRNRPLLMNDGQALHLTQTVDVVYQQHAPDPAPAFTAQAGGIQATAKWQRVDDHTLRRSAEITVTKPLVATADYSAVRDLLRRWDLYLAH